MWPGAGERARGHRRGDRAVRERGGRSVHSMHGPLRVPSPLRPSCADWRGSRGPCAVRAAWGFAVAGARLCNPGTRKPRRAGRCCTRCCTPASRRPGALRSTRSNAPRGGPTLTWWRGRWRARGSWGTAPRRPPWFACPWNRWGAPRRAAPRCRDAPRAAGKSARRMRESGRPPTPQLESPARLPPPRRSCRRWSRLRTCTRAGRACRAPPRWRSGVSSSPQPPCRHVPGRGG
jgi:hypothetical protein